MKRENKIKVSEIARTAGVSPATVSRVINQPDIVSEDTVNKVVSAMKDLGCSLDAFYAPKSASGLVLIHIPSLNNPFYGTIIKGAKTSIARHGYSALIHEGSFDQNSIGDFLQILKQNKIAGVISTDWISSVYLNKIAELVPIVQCCEYNSEVDLPYVSIDDRSSSRLAVEHLLAQGRKRIAFINGPIRFKYARHRLDGFLSALNDAGIRVQEDFIIQLPEIDAGLATSAALQLLNQSNPPDAFFTISDIYGAAILRACYLAGKRVPNDVAVIGFDNIEISKFLTPALSTVNQPKSQLGFLAAETLFEKISNPAAPNKKIMLETELIIRESSLELH